MVEVERNSPLEEETLVRLLERAQVDGDPEAFDHLYLLYADRVFRFLFVRLNDAETAEEITAQAFLQLIEKIDQYRIAPQDNVAIFSAWFYRLAYNKMIDAQRRKQRKRTVGLDQAEHVPTAQRVAEQVIEQIEYEQILEKLHMLNEQQRQVILLRFIEGFSIAETAQIMQKTEGAIKALQHRSLENLRRFFE